MTSSQHAWLLALAFVAPTLAAQPAAQPAALPGYDADAAQAQRALEARFDSGLKDADYRGWLKQWSSAPNHVGSPHNLENARDLQTRLCSYGWDARIETFEVLWPSPKTSQLELLGAKPYVARLKEPPLPGDSTSSQTENVLPPYVIYGGNGDVTGDPLQLPAIPEFEVLAQLLDATPELARLNGEQRVREARVRLARSQARPDLDWQVGVRRLEGNDATALLGSVSLALGSAARAQPEIRAAEAELSLLDIERQSQALVLYTTLADAHGRYRAAQLEVTRMRSDVLPALARADAAAERAYRAGATSYLDWAQLQAQRSDARQQQLAAALEAQTALIEIQRLTGQPFVLDSAAQVGP
ncbi:hypothetical protein XGA_1496 [Xanthomonas hortorum ATCC 19865]|nr:TolC family protein [Xanthomonas hortorum]EGD19857.1 hypothetical protein XGA_1496 [Xanthomonas hortorum ATCC 19865]